MCNLEKHSEESVALEKIKPQRKQQKLLCITKCVSKITCYLILEIVIICMYILI